ncbi:hypothetical protein PCL_09709 [Purpureocillium lilacinum]|uniref:Uncharacterized protein n=1 Tax=Purpureocillium lilacinum TaxID=33203 RepID=A0A2U3EDU5_PURLI|nr:hypothetical protein PCL_09709 [Purpureocillium lilacinum]
MEVRYMIGFSLRGERLRTTHAWAGPAPSPNVKTSTSTPGSKKRMLTMSAVSCACESRMAFCIAFDPLFQDGSQRIVINTAVMKHNDVRRGAFYWVFKAERSYSDTTYSLFGPHARCQGRRKSVAVLHRQLPPRTTSRSNAFNIQRQPHTESCRLNVHHNAAGSRSSFGRAKQHRAPDGKRQQSSLEHECQDCCSAVLAAHAVRHGSALASVKATLTGEEPTSHPCPRAVRPQWLSASTPARHAQQGAHSSGTGPPGPGGRPDCGSRRRRVQQCQ